MYETLTHVKERQVLLIALAGILLIIFGVTSTVIELIAVLFCLFVVLFSNDDTASICCLACWVNAAQVFKLNVDGTSFYTILVLLFAVKKLLQYRKIEKNFLVIILIYAVYLVPGMRNEYFMAVKNIMMPIQLYLMAMSLDYRSLKHVSGYFILGTIIESTAAMVQTMIPGLAAYIADDNTYAVKTLQGYIPETRFSGLWPDPNYYSIHLLLGILICVILYSRREIKALTLLVVTVILTWFGAQTLSKSFILMLAVILVYAYALFIKNRQFGSVALMSLALLILLILISTGVIDIFSMILERLEEGMRTGNGLTTGRSDLWRNYTEYFLDNPRSLLFGDGLGLSLPLKKAPHNAYLEIVLYIGLIGTFIFCLSIYNAVVAAWQLPLRGTVVPLFCTLMMYFFLGMYNSMDLQFELLLVFGYLWMNKEDKAVTKELKWEGNIVVTYEINPDCQ